MSESAQIGLKWPKSLKFDCGLQITRFPLMTHKSAVLLLLISVKNYKITLTISSYQFSNCHVWKMHFSLRLFKDYCNASSVHVPRHQFLFFWDQSAVFDRVISLTVFQIPGVDLLIGNNKFEACRPCYSNPVYCSLDSYHW